MTGGQFGAHGTCRFEWLEPGRGGRGTASYASMGKFAHTPHLSYQAQNSGNISDSLRREGRKEGVASKTWFGKYAASQINSREISNTIVRLV